MSDQRYVLVGDDSGHDYCIPRDKREEWYELNFDSDEVPDWATRIDGNFSFTGPCYD